jgi:nicotinate dehydrogenase subunit B
MADMAGQFEYVHNVRLPGMLHGRVVRPPAVGATLISVADNSVKGMPGLVKVVTRKNFVGIVAEKPWQARRAAEQLKASWKDGASLPSQQTFYEFTQPAFAGREAGSKDTERTLSTAATVLKTTYYHPYQMHGSVNFVRGGGFARDKATIYSPTQKSGTRNYVGNDSGIETGERARDLPARFGMLRIKRADTVTYDAAVLSQAVGKPVRVQLSRKDEMAWENFGNAWVIEERAGLDQKGNIIAWEHESWTPSLGNRPGPETPGNIVTGMLLGYQPQPFTPGAVQEPKAYSNNSNGIPSYAAGHVGGSNGGTGTVKSESDGPQSALALLDRTSAIARASANTFAHSFMDELAARSADPVEFRLRHLHDER